MKELEEEWIEIQSYFIIDEINNVEMPIISIKDLAAICNKEEIFIQKLISKTARLCGDIGIKKTFNKGIVDDNIGLVSIYFITLYFSEVDFFLTRFQSYIKEEIFEIGLKAIGHVVSRRTMQRSITMGSASGKSYDELIKMNTEKKISEAYKYPIQDLEDTSHYFFNKKVVITGTFENFPMRDEMAKMLHSVGADVNGSISKKTNYVIVGSNAGPRKLEKIEELQISIINEEEFINLFK